MVNAEKRKPGRPKQLPQNLVKKHIQFSKDVAERLAVFAKHEKMSEASIIRFAVCRYLDFAGF